MIAMKFTPEEMAEIEAGRSEVVSRSRAWTKVEEAIADVLHLLGVPGVPNFGPRRLIAEMLRHEAHQLESREKYDMGGVI